MGNLDFVAYNWGNYSLYQSTVFCEKDIVLMDDNLKKISLARIISKKAYKTIKENIIVGVGIVHFVGIVLVLCHIIGPVQAAAIHLLPDTLVFINSIKLLKLSTRKSINFP